MKKVFLWADSPTLCYCLLSDGISSF